MLGEADRLRAIVDDLYEGFQIVDRAWRYLYVNDGALQHARTTREALLGRTMMDAFPGIEETAMFTLAQRCMTEWTSAEMENLFTYPDGSTAWFELRMRPVQEGLLILSVDITRRKELEEQLLHAQKMEAVGRLASGIAHDFNNILTAISSFGSLAATSLEHDHAARRDVEEVLSATGRAAQLVRQLLEFSRKRPIEPKLVDVNELVGDVESLLRRVLGEEVALMVERSDQACTVRIDPTAFEQVLVNLAVNSRDAMTGDGVLTIETRRAQLSSEHSMVRGEPVSPGEYVLVEISDNGHGMDQETIDHAFDPFFTTKAEGRGTGLGLSTSFGIVRQAGGYIWLYSEPGAGTTFKIYLPHAEGSATTTEVDADGSEPLHGNERVLVVEDDSQIRSLTARGLSHYGYDVMLANSCADALALCATDPRPIHLLLSDLVMPGMGGRALAEKVVITRPLLRVLFMSGYSASAAVHGGLIGPEARLLEKPFTPEILARAVRETLDAWR